MGNFRKLEFNLNLILSFLSKRSVASFVKIKILENKKKNPKPSHIVYVLCIFMPTKWRENTLKNMCGDLKG